MKEKILIIEDNMTNRILLKDLLVYHDYEVYEAEDGETGLTLAAEIHPALIFIDIQMPVLDGYTTIKLLKAKPGNEKTKIIIVTSFAMAGDKEKFLASGADEYLSKPLATREIPQLVNKILNNLPKGDNDVQ